MKFLSLGGGLRLNNGNGWWECTITQELVTLSWICMVMRRNHGLGSIEQTVVLHWFIPGEGPGLADGGGSDAMVDAVGGEGVTGPLD